MRCSNPVDKYVEELHKVFKNIPYFDVLQKSDTAKSIFDSLTTKMVEVNNLKSLYKDYYCPASIKCIEEQKRLITKSKYIKLPDVKEELQDIYYSTIRNGYVQLLHATESYINLLFDNVNVICATEGNKSIERFCIDVYNFDIKMHWKRIDQTVEKINWISNRIKHDDGLPNNDINQWPLEYLASPTLILFDENKRMKFEIEEFIKDIKETLQFFVTISFIIAKLYVLQMSESLINSLKKNSELPLIIKENINTFDNSRNGLHNEITEIVRLWKYIGIDEKQKGGKKKKCNGK